MHNKIFQYIVIVIIITYSRVHILISTDTSININLKGSTIGRLFYCVNYKQFTIFFSDSYFLKFSPARV